MALMKVAGVIFARKLLTAMGEETVSRFLQSLTPEDRKCFQALLPTDKLPIEQVTRFYEALVPVLFPDKSLAKGLWQLGYQLAQNDMKGIYRALLRIATVEMVIKQAAMIWQTYNEKGQASVQRVNNKKYVFIVENYPEISKNSRIVNDGYITGLCNLTGVKNLNVVRYDDNPNAWKWNITFD
jgi:hypothetical protein